MATPDDTAFVLDVMCGGIRSILRMAGYDTVYALDRGVEDDDSVREIAESEDRVLITRDESLAAATSNSILVRSKDADDQLAELADAGVVLSLSEPVRCSRCNGRLEAVADEESTPDYAPDPDEKQRWRCMECGQLFWKGSHWDDVAERLSLL